MFDLINKTTKQAMTSKQFIAQFIHICFDYSQATQNKQCKWWEAKNYAIVVPTVLFEKMFFFFRIILLYYDFEVVWSQKMNRK